jgi:hypothetical protein
MHRAAIRSLGIVESKIREKGPETKSTSGKENQKEKSKYNFEITSAASHQKRKGDRRGKRTQEI